MAVSRCYTAFEPYYLDLCTRVWLEEINLYFYYFLFMVFYITDQQSTNNIDLRVSLKVDGMTKYIAQIVW